MLKRLLSLALVCTCATAFAASEDKGEGHEKHKPEPITLDQAPVAVQAAIKAAGGTVKEVEKAKHGDKVVYLAKVTDADGKTKELKFDEAGKAIAGHDHEKGEHEKGEHDKAEKGEHHDKK